MRTIQRDIVGAFIFSADNKLLIGKAGVYQGTWCIPGGGIDADETKLQAVIREVHEETGLDIQNEQIELLDLPLTGQSEKTLRDTGERVMVGMTFFNFTVRLDAKAAAITLAAQDDFTDARWVTAEELHKLPLSPPTIKTLQYLGFLHA